MLLIGDFMPEEVEKSHIIDVSEMSNTELANFMKENAISLKIEEARMITDKLGRNPTLTELHIFNIEWSEHCSYKSSRDILKLLPTDGPNVIQGPKEDAGIIYLTTIDGEKYGVVMAHESHNHPSQVVPYEGAATGIGGIVRDVLCMGAKVIATADPLRFGNPSGKFKERTKYIANSVVDGIAGYTNPIGIPNIAGDVYFNDSFDDNCIVNVACLGLVKESEIIHSCAPSDSVDYDIVLVGKATDNSGFGGAAFASLILDEEDKESNKGAVQVPDPFLKNVLIRATYDVFKEVREKKINIGFKDLGAGGIMCASSELCESGGYGAEVDISKIHTSMKNLPPYVIACSETQERFMWISPKEFTPKILKIYNEDWELPNVAECARAVVVGKVTKEKDFVMKHEDKIVCNAPIEEVTTGIKYQRPSKKGKKEFKEPEIGDLPNYNSVVLDVLKHPNVASRSKIYEHYDTEVQGNAVIRSGEADAGLICPIPGNSSGVALSVDANPKYSRIDPYKGGVCAVAEAMRNVAAIGAVPSGMTDCLNFGNPEIPEAFDDFVESVKGIADAANKIYLKGTKDPVPFVSGNVSFYNESATGKSVDPSPIIACVGIMEDFSKAITMKIKKEGSGLYLIGPRKNQLGGSVYYDLFNEIGANLPEVDFELEKNMIYSVIDSIEKGLILSCHDISDGGLITTISEMILGGRADGKIGAFVQLNDDMKTNSLIFSETSGFVMEIENDKAEEVEKICAKHNIDIFKIGETTNEKKLIVNHNGEDVVDTSIEEMKEAWTSGLKEAME